MTTFARLGLNKTLQSNVKSLGYKKPTFVQEKAIGAVLSGTDTYAIAPTGTGKTAAYLLPVLQELSQTNFSEEQVRPIRALFLVPTRELAQQVEASIGLYGQGLKLRTISVFGGVRIQSHVKRFKRGTDILVATPRRLVDLLKNKTISLNQVKHFVMDEADRLVSMGIVNELKSILAALPDTTQKVLFSATDTKALNKFYQAHTHRVKVIKGGDIQPPLDKIVHTLYRCPLENKQEHLFKLLTMLDCDHALIFARTKKDVDFLTRALNEQGFNSAGIHNEVPQKRRKERLASFKNGEFKFLVATDIASRGIDISNLYYVINYDLPVNSNDYIHRVGRTARTKTAKLDSKKVQATQVENRAMSKEMAAKNRSMVNPAPEVEFALQSKDVRGHAFSLVSPEQERLIPKIKNVVGKEIKLERMPW